MLGYWSPPFKLLNPGKFPHDLYSANLVPISLTKPQLLWDTICQSPIFLDQFLLDTPHIKYVMFNIKLLIWRQLRLHDTEWYKMYWKKQYKYKLCLEKHSNCNTQFSHISSVILITGVFNMFIIVTLGIPSHEDRIHQLKSALAQCSLQNSFTSYLVFILQVGLNHVFILPMLVWLTQGDIHTTVWSTQMLRALYLKQRPPSSLLCGKKKSASLHNYPSFMCTSPLRFSSDLSSILRVYSASHIPPLGV